MTEINFSKSNELNEITDSPIVRMEGIKEAAALFGLPKNLVRTLALEGKIKAVRVSRSQNAKILVNIQSLNDYFNNSFIGSDEQKELPCSIIKPIPVKL